MKNNFTGNLERDGDMRIYLVHEEIKGTVLIFITKNSGSIVND